MAGNTVERYEHRDCNGCQMCGDICPRQAISFKMDELTGFKYPVVDSDKCIECGLCVKKCPHNNPVRREVLPKADVIAAWSKNDEVRLLCTSGGLFYEMAMAVIEQGGAVVACSYTEDYRGAYHTVATTGEELIPLCGSKHLQSETEGIYKKTKELLGSYNKVLFVGTPCQIAALYRYMGTEPENLITADFICNSINSPKAQARYIDYLEDEYGGKITYARSKDKRDGWTTFGSSAKFANGREYYADRNHDARVVGYHYGHLFIRESCLNCQYKELPRNADITLGDFWGIGQDERNPKMELGTSVVMINSVKGAGFMEQLKMNIGWYQKTLEDAISGNPAILHAATTNGNGRKAFAALDKMRFDQVVEKYKTKSSLKNKIRRKAGSIKKHFKEAFLASRGSE